jgi:hypothetical protein
MPRGIVENVPEHLSQPPLVAAHPDWLQLGCDLQIRDCSQPPDLRVQDVFKINILDVQLQLMGVDLRKRQQVLHQRLHAVRLAEHRVLHVEPGLATLVEACYLCGRHQRRQRAAQLVARVGEEGPV